MSLPPLKRLEGIPEPELADVVAWAEERLATVQPLDGGQYVMVKPLALQRLVAAARLGLSGECGSRRVEDECPA